MIKYFVLSNNGRKLEEYFNVNIKLDDFELPINININLQSCTVQLYTKDTIKDGKVVRDYQKKLEQFKATSTFVSTFK